MFAIAARKFDRAAKKWLTQQKLLFNRPYISKFFLRALIIDSLFIFDELI